MSTLESIKSELQEIIADSNATTGGNATTVRDGVDALISGFGSADLSDIVALLGDGEVVEGSGSGGGTGSLDGLKDGWDVMFYDENNEGLAFYSVKQGHTINPPIYTCKAWQKADGVNVTFPYKPTEDTILYALNDTYASMIYKFYEVDSAVYPYLNVYIGSSDLCICFASYVCAQIATTSSGVTSTTHYLTNGSYGTVAKYSGNIGDTEAIVAHIMSNKTTLTEFTNRATTVQAGVYTNYYNSGDGTICDRLDEIEPKLIYKWDFTKGLTDLVANTDAVISSFAVDSGASGTLPTLNNDGISLTGESQYIYLGEVNLLGKRIEIDVANFDFNGDTSKHIRFLMCANSNTITSTTRGFGPLIWRAATGWAAYLKSQTYAVISSNSAGWSSGVYGNLSGSDSEVINFFSGKTVRVDVGTEGQPTLYVNGEKIGHAVRFVGNDTNHIYIGGAPTTSYGASGGNQCYNMRITGVRIYDLN